ncbi:hypothetical protein DFH08DRAFT_824625 [Mycena albidolilacea]|uniref:Uncharacterized protein n=1 Tax=Mycena albidolilacea TaxID=1033008 RepID=A0AAD7EA26_9AGAR|nr:hypothetical protein DFH08DRAFT_824625 [Mycena albidolilacea]
MPVNGVTTASEIASDGLGIPTPVPLLSTPLLLGIWIRIPPSAAAIALPESFWGGRLAGSEAGWVVYARCVEHGARVAVPAAAEANHHYNHHTPTLHIQLRPTYCPDPWPAALPAVFHARCTYRAGSESIPDLPLSSRPLLPLPIFSWTLGIGILIGVRIDDERGQHDEAANVLSTNGGRATRGGGGYCALSLLATILGGARCYSPETPVVFSAMGKVAGKDVWMSLGQRAANWAVRRYEAAWAGKTGVIG